MNLFNRLFPKRMVGVDLGTSAIKVVEISRWGGGKTLENYGEVKSAVFQKDSPVSWETQAKVLKAILSEAKIKTTSAVFSIPDFSTFCTSFEIPPMPEAEIAGAIRYNASQYITLPIDEVVLDWQVLPGSSGAQDILPLKVFLVAVPKQVVQEYQNIAKAAGLELYALEAEAMGIVRAVVNKTKQGKKTVVVVDIGVQSSTINIVDGGFLKRSYSFNFNGGQLAKSPETISTILLDPLILEIKNICAEFLQSEKKEVQEVYVAGGAANAPGLKEYVQESIKKPVIISNCFSEMLYASVLEKSLTEMAPRYCAAVGVALGGLQI